MTKVARKPVAELEGRELDAAVAEEVMGWKVGHDGFGWLIYYAGAEHTGWKPGKFSRREADPFHPSTDIAAAWKVVEKLEGPACTIQLEYAYSSESWYARIVGHPTREDATGYSDTFADTAPEAICRAALKAVRKRE